MEAEWLEVQAAQRNPAYFRPLYDRYYTPIFRFIYKRTADEELTADLCAQTFLKAIQKLADYEYRGLPFSSWLYRIATNEVTQHFRTVQKNRVVTIEEQAFHLMAEEASNEYEETFALNLSKLQEVIQQLEDDDVRLLELRFFEQRPFAEVSEIMGITENNAKVKTYRLLQKLKKMMS